MVNSVDDELWVINTTTDKSGYCTSLDESWSALTGQELSEGLGYGWFDAVHPDDLANMIEALSGALDQRKAFRHEFRVRRRDGVYRWALAAGAPRFDADGFLGYAGSIVDIHMSRVARHALRESEEKLRLALAAAEMGTFAWDFEGSLCERDARMLELFGQPPDGLLSLSIAIDRDIHPEDRVRFAEAVARACDPDGDGRLREDVRVRWPDGTLRWLQISAQVQFANEPRRPRRMIGAAVDVTARELAKEAIASSEERLAIAHDRLTATLRASPVVAFEQDSALRYVWIQNPVLEHGAEEMVGRTDAELMEREEDAYAVMAIKRRVLETGVSAREEICVHIRGALRWFDLIVEPRRNGRAVVGLLCTATDITDHKNAEEALKEADRRKDKFLAVLGHELRNPLASIQNCIEVLKTKDVLTESEAARTAIQMVARQAGHLARLIDELLDVSRIYRDKISLRRGLVDFGLVLRETLEALHPQIDEKGLRLEACVPAKPLTLFGDSIRLTQIASNLIGNAVKYSDPGGAVRIEVERQDDDAVLTVTDEGVGIPPEFLPRVFDLFAQGGPEHEDGLGIGLALSKKLVELHGGVIEARSPGVGKGSTFVVRLPLATSGSATRADMPSKAGNLARGVKVLFIDDNHDVADSFAMLMRGLDVPVRVAYDGASGVEEAAAFRPDIAFVDIRMPGIDGYETARRIRARMTAQAPALVALSGLGQERDKKLAHAAGFDLHLVKPVPIEVIQQVIGQLAPLR